MRTDRRRVAGVAALAIAGSLVLSAWALADSWRESNPVVPAHGCVASSAGADAGAAGAMVEAGDQGCAYLPALRRTSRPTFVGRLDPEMPARVVVDDRHAYVLVDVVDGGRAHVQILERPPEHPWEMANLTLVGRTPAVPESACDLAVDGQRLYVTTRDPMALGATIRVYNVSAPAAPRLLGELSNPGFGCHMVVGDGIAFLANTSLLDAANGASLVAVNARDPERMFVAGGLVLADGVQDLAVGGHYVYAADNARAMRVIDVADPTRPRLVASVEVIGSAYRQPVRLAVAGDRAFAVTAWADPSPNNPSGVRVFDVSNPTHPRFVTDNSRYVSESVDLAVAAGKRLYVHSSPGRNVGLLVHELDGSHLNVVGQYERVSGGEKGAPIAVDDHDV